MVDSRIQLRSLSTGELTGIINIYPWFGGARKELCRRMAREGGATEEQFAELDGFELRFGESEQSFLVGYNRFDSGKPMYGWIEYNGNKIL